MSDGGRESGRDNQTASTSLRKGQQQHQQQRQRQKPSCGDEYTHAVSKIAVAQISESTGFQSAHRLALDTLAEVALRYIRHLGRSMSSNANMAGRTSCNVFDAVQGLEDLGSSQGFSGASDPHRCLVHSGVIREITQFVNMGKEVPFARSVLRWPVARVPNTTLSFDQVGEKQEGKHIPDWLPKFPDPHTYIHKPVWNEGAIDAKEDKIEKARQRRKAESSLLSLQQRLACNSIAGFVPIGDGDTGKEKHVAGTNTFLAQPLPYGDKEVSEIAFPSESLAGKRMSVLETFAPAIEAAKVNSLEFKDCDKRSLPRNRPVVKFKIGVEKKSIAASLAFSALNSKNDSWSLRDDERADRKRRAEMILKEAMEKPHDLAQL